MSPVEFLLRLGCALLCGVFIGVERQWRQRTAGLRTYTLVAVGSALFVMLGTLTPCRLGLLLAILRRRSFSPRH